MGLTGVPLLRAGGSASRVQSAQCRECKECSFQSAERREGSQLQPRLQSGQSESVGKKGGTQERVVFLLVFAKTANQETKKLKWRAAE